MKPYLPYTGVGSRDTPPEFLALIKQYAKILDKKGFTLRSGGARGADSAFESVSNNKEIYFPSNNSKIDNNTYFFSESKLNEWKYMLDYYYLGPRIKKEYTKNLHARNIAQVLGFDVDSPSFFLICYTPDGLENLNYTPNSGGTRTAIFVAYKHNIPIFNIKNKCSRDNLEHLLTII